MTNSPNAATTLPADSWPSWPFTRITRVDATLRANRSIVAKRSTVGNEENSSGLRVLIAIMMISKLDAILKVNSTSNKNAGNGTTNMPMINNTKAGMLRPVKLNRDRLCRNVDSDSVVIDYQSEIKGASST